jgi:hypothetical protein
MALNRGFRHLRALKFWKEPDKIACDRCGDHVAAWSALEWSDWSIDRRGCNYHDSHAMLELCTACSRAFSARITEAIDNAVWPSDDGQPVNPKPSKENE